MDRPERAGGRRSRARTLSTGDLWAFLAVALPALAALAAVLSVGDLAYQVRAGRLMLDDLTILRTDPFSLTVMGEPWLNVQWGSQIVFGLVHRAGGWEGLVVLRAALFGAAFWLVYLTCRARGAVKRVAAWLTLASLLLASTIGSSFGLRPQLLALPLFALSLWIVVGRRERPQLLWVLPVVVAVWSNLHGSFVLGPLLIGLGLLEDLADRSPRTRRMLTVGGLALLATLASPFGVGTWRYVVDLSTDPVVTRFISEWQPPTVRSLSGGAFFLSAGAVAVLVARSGRRLRWPTVLWLLVFLGIGLQAERNLVWWSFGVLPVVVPLLPEPRTRPDPPTAGASAIAAALLLLGILLLPWWRSALPFTGTRPLLSEAPAGVGDELERILEPGEGLFNAQNWGSWIEFALPAHPVFVDSRIEVFPEDVWDDYVAVSSGRSDWEEILDRWEIRVVAAKRTQQEELIPLIREDADWSTAYEDGDGFVFVRTGG
ncbi:MAG TPA: hypothetical protein VE669_11390 [Actinomycetota bacterium]|nr:hypothetical protein [Actinomycetota bacterium]